VLYDKHLEAAEMQCLFISAAGAVDDVSDVVFRRHRWRNSSDGEEHDWKVASSGKYKDNTAARICRVSTQWTSAEVIRASFTNLFRNRVFFTSL